jgi:hypothetical protein
MCISLGKNKMKVLLAIMALLLIVSCAEREYKPLPEGGIAIPPAGYNIHCKEFPDSIFCPEVD